MKKYKRVLSISLGSSTRDSLALITILGKEVEIKRIGTDGDMDKAARLFEKYDGSVDSFGLGGTDLGLMVCKQWYPLHSVLKIVKNVKKTPVVDGTGLKTVLETQSAGVLLKSIDNTMFKNKYVLIMSGCDRWGLQQSFLDAGFSNIYGDLIFGLNIPFAMRSRRQVMLLAKLLLPLASRLPFEWIYPTGKKQHFNNPRASSLFSKASIIAGDRHYIRRYMPPDLAGKSIVTNSTTGEDVAAFKLAGVKTLITTTPVYNGRSFGTNVLEAALVAIADYSKPIDYNNSTGYFEWLTMHLAETDIQPQCISW
jgi:hypothetical protein